jgi:hypothetical protein
MERTTALCGRAAMRRCGAFVTFQYLEHRMLERLPEFLTERVSESHSVAMPSALVHQVHARRGHPAMEAFEEAF